MVDDSSKDDQFDDVDFDDLDEDLDGEDWDDFDDDATSDDNVAMDDDIIDDSGMAAASKDKTFLQKNFNLIVIGVAVLGGGALVLPMIMGGDEASPSEQVAMMEDDGMGELPVLGSQSDLNETGSDITDQGQTESSNDLFADLDSGDDMGGSDNGNLLSGDEGLTLNDDVLTPLPEDDDSDIVLSSLDDELADADALPDLNFNDDLEGDAPASEDIADSNDLMMDEPVSNEIPDLALPTDDMDAEPEQALSGDNSLDMPASEDSQLTDMASQNAVNNDAIKEKDALIEKLREENKNIETLNANMRTEIAALKEENELLKASQGEKAVAKPAQAIEKPAKTTQSTPAAAVKTTAAPKQVRKVEWVLKAAQPGQATISSKNSNDIRQIEVGSTVSGLGKITSIGIEDGKWVVRGTTGHVSQ